VSKLAFQFQQTPSWMGDVVLASHSQWALLIEPPEKDPFDGKVKVLGRQCFPGGDSEEERYVLRGAAGADAYFERLHGAYNARRYVTVWQGPNEPWVGERTQRVSLADFTWRWAELMHNDSFRVGTGAFSVGRPDYLESHIAELLPACLAGDYVIVHEYSAPRMQSRAGDHCLRYRWLYDAMRELVNREPPPLLIGECGIDGGVAPVHRARTGWKTFTTSFESYLQQLIWYDQQIQKDDYVVAAFPFVCGARQDWRDFDIDEGNARLLAAYMAGGTGEGGWPLPEQEQGDLPKLLVKLRWWFEEMQRMYESGELERANRIRLSMIKLLYRIEGMAKEI